MAIHHISTESLNYIEQYVSLRAGHLRLGIVLDMVQRHLHEVWDIPKSQSLRIVTTYAFTTHTYGFTWNEEMVEKYAAVLINGGKPLIVEGLILRNEVWHPDLNQVTSSHDVPQWVVSIREDSFSGNSDC